MVSLMRSACFGSAVISSKVRLTVLAKEVMAVGDDRIVIKYVRLGHVLMRTLENLRNGGDRGTEAI